MKYVYECALYPSGNSYPVLAHEGAMPLRVLEDAGELTLLLEAESLSNFETLTFYVLNTAEQIPVPSDSSKALFYIDSVRVASTGIMQHIYQER